MKIIDFKTVSPLFEMERDGIKPFTERLFDYKDKRFRALTQWEFMDVWYVRITNPTTGERFIRRLDWVDYMRIRRNDFIKPYWYVLCLGAKLELDEK